MKGPGNCVDQAVAMIKEYLDDLIAQVTESVEVEKHFHGEIIGKGGKQVQEVRTIKSSVLITISPHVIFTTHAWMYFFSF